MAGAFVVVGAGSIGQRHAHNLEALGQSVTLIPYRAFDAALPYRRGPTSRCRDRPPAAHIRLSWSLLRHVAGPSMWKRPLAWTVNRVFRFTTQRRRGRPRRHRFHGSIYPAIMALAAKAYPSIGSHSIRHDVRQWRANWSLQTAMHHRPLAADVLRTCATD
jgi:hypothetical protein